MKLSRNEKMILRIVNKWRRESAQIEGNDVGEFRDYNCQTMNGKFNLWRLCSKCYEIGRQDGKAERDLISKNYFLKPKK